MKEKVLEISKKFWKVMEDADEKGMREIALPECKFTHIGVTADLDTEIKFYTDKIFKPTKIEFHNQEARIVDSTAVVLTDCDYSLLLNDEETTHHFMVSETYVNKDDEWKLLQFSFTALIY